MSLKATARAGGRTVTVARASASFDPAGARDVSLKVTAAGKRALHVRRNLAVTVRATARERGGQHRVDDGVRPAAQATRLIRIS